MMRRRIGVVLVLALAAGAAAAQQLYRWTDEKGRVHITDTPPPAGAKDVQKRPGTIGPSTGADQSSANEPYALQVARKNYPVTLYTSPGCEGCADARRLLNARGVPFQEVSVTSREQVDKLEQAVGANAVPSLLVGATVQRGYHEALYHSILDAAGYPKTGAIPARKQEEPKPGETTAEAKPAPEVPRGPYAPGAPPQRSQKR
jgi:glutaredoxin